jgi:hypothetical protein
MAIPRDFSLKHGKEVSPTEHKLPPGPGGGIQKYGHPANGSAAVRPISPLTWRGSPGEITQPSPFPLPSPRSPALFAQVEWLHSSCNFWFRRGWAIRSFFGFGWWMGGPRIYVVIKAVLTLDLAKGGSLLP